MSLEKPRLDLNKPPSALARTIADFLLEHDEEPLWILYEVVKRALGKNTTPAVCRQIFKTAVTLYMETRDAPEPRPPV